VTRITEGHLARHYQGVRGGRDAALLDIAQDHALRLLHNAGLVARGLVFKGGTALRKFRAGNAGRFSTDLDFAAPDEEVALAALQVLDGVEVDGFTFAIENLGDDGRRAGDEGWPFGVALRWEASNRHMLRWLKTVVVSDVEKAFDLTHTRRMRKWTDPSVTCNMSDVANRDINKRVADHRDRLREQGLRPLQIWVPDTRAPEFAQEAHRQSALAAATDSAADDQAWVDDISQFNDEDFDNQ